MSRLPRCGSREKSADLFCANEFFFFIPVLTQSELFFMLLPRRADGRYWHIDSFEPLPLYQLSSKLSLWPVALLSASALHVCDHHSTQQNPWGSENINHTYIGFRNINHTCLALRDLLIVVFIRTDILTAYFFQHASRT